MDEMTAELISQLQTLIGQLVNKQDEETDAVTKYLGDDDVPAEWASMRHLDSRTSVTAENAEEPHLALLSRTKYLLDLIEETQQQIPGTEKFEELYDKLKELEVSAIRDDLEYLRKFQTLTNRYTKDKFWVELFSKRNSLADVQAYDVEEAVTGSDCIDLFNTSPIVGGRDYVIKSDEGQEEIRVSEILTSSRIRSTTDLARSYHDAKLYRTTFAFGDYEGDGGLATAKQGDVYYSEPIRLNAYGLLQNVYIGRDTGDAVFKIYYKDESDEAQDWTELEKKADILRDSDTMENIFTLPKVQGALELRIVCESGSADIYYIILHLSYVDEGASLTTVPWGQISGQIENQKDLMDKLANAGSIATTEKHGIVKLAKIPVEEA